MWLQLEDSSRVGSAGRPGSGPKARIVSIAYGGHCTLYIRDPAFLLYHDDFVAVHSWSMLELWWVHFLVHEMLLKPQDGYIKWTTKGRQTNCNYNKCCSLKRFFPRPDDRIGKSLSVFFSLISQPCACVTHLNAPVIVSVHSKKQRTVEYFFLRFRPLESFLWLCTCNSLLFISPVGGVLSAGFCLCSAVGPFF